MTYVLVSSEQYNRRAARFLKRRPEIREQYCKTLLLLQANSHHPSLRLHALAGTFAGLHSISISLSYRITIDFILRERQIVPINVSAPGESDDDSPAPCETSPPERTPRRRPLSPQ